MTYIPAILTHLLLLATGVTGNPAGNGDAAIAKWIVEPNSSLNIQGRSNISRFQCDVIEYLHPDTLVFMRDDRERKLTFINSCLTIDINRFDCHQSYITSDFRKTLKSNEERHLRIHFLSIDGFQAGNTEQTVRGLVEIELAGVKREAILNYTFKRIDAGHVQLDGTRIFRFADFNLTPPRKLAGLIRIEQEITVNFKLFLKTA